jgi:hypothetical protein
MSQNRYYHQCSLSKGTTRTLTHLPEKFAVQGNRIALKNDDGTWDRGWKVTHVGEPILAEFAEAKAHAYTDIWKPSTALTDRGKK